MIAILLNGDYAYGYNSDVGAVVQSGLNYVGADEVPAAFTDLKPNQRVKYVDGDFIIVDIEQPPDELAQLKQQLAAKEEQIARLSQDMADQTNAILDIYDILGGI